MSADPKKLLEEAHALLASHKNALKGDEIVPDLQGFEDLIKQLCAEVTKLPPNEVEEYKKQLLELGSSLESLAKSLEEKKNQVQEQIEGLDFNKKAQIAYRVAGSLSKQDQEEEK